MREAILLFIKNYIKEHGYAPTVREIGQGVGLKSTSSIHSHLKKMKMLGMIDSDVGLNCPRAIRVVGMKFVEES